MKSISLIQAIVLIDQGPCQTKSAKWKNLQIDRFESTRRNLSMAKKLADEILGREIAAVPFETKIAFLLMEEMAERACAGKRVKRSALRLSMKSIQAYTGWDRLILQLHINRLKKMKYVEQKANQIVLIYRSRVTEIVDGRLVFGVDY